MDNRIDKRVPCIDCAERTADCHSVCEKYKAFRAEMDKLCEARKTAFEADYKVLQRKLKPGGRFKKMWA